MLSKEIQLEQLITSFDGKFYTIQERVIIRVPQLIFYTIGGCDVGCHWCDVKESWNAELHPTASVIVRMQVNMQTVVVTGGG
jgi:organic radical activating enzyme